MKRVFYFVSFVLGIFISGFFNSYISYLAITLFAILVILKYRNLLKFRNIIILCVCLGLGISYFNLFNNHFNRRYEGINIEELSGQIIVSSVPVVYDNRSTFVGKIACESFENVKAEITVYDNKEIELGEIYSFENFKLSYIEDKNSGTSYNRKLLSNSRGLYLKAIGNHENIKLVERPNNLNLFVKLANFREKINFTIAKYFYGDEYMFLSGILLGNKEGNSEKFNSMLATTGLSHVVVVSGMHFSILMMFLTIILRKFGIRRKLVSVIVILFSFLIAIFMGFTPSILRALLMIILINIAEIIDRDKNTGINSIVLTLAIMLIINPLMIYDIGFILSFASVLGIIILTPMLNEKFLFLPYRIRTIISVSLSANIFTLPFLIYYFGKISLIFLIGNVIITPILPFIMIYGILSIIFGFLGIDITFFLSLTLKLIIKFLYFISNSIPFASVNVISFSRDVIVIYYILISLMLIFKGKVCRIFCLIGMLALIITLFIPFGNNKIVCLDNSDGGKNLIIDKFGQITFIDLSYSPTDTYFLDNSMIKYINMKNRGVIENYILGNRTQIGSLNYLRDKVKIKNLYVPTELALEVDCSYYNVIKLNDKGTINFPKYLLTLNVNHMYNVLMVSFESTNMRGIFTNIPVDNNSYNFVVPHNNVRKFYKNSYSDSVKIISNDETDKQGIVELEF